VSGVHGFEGRLGAAKAAVLPEAGNSGLRARRAISRSRRHTFKTMYTTSKSALGWLANKGERWMPRLEMAMKDAA
jgi:hypothetical protein